MNKIAKYIDIHSLKRPFGLLALTIVFSTGLFSSSYWFKSMHTMMRDQNADRLHSLQDTELKTRESGRIYKNFYGRYRKLNEIGFMGSERRLLWIEALRQASTAQHLYDVEYSISEQRPYNGHLFVDQQQYAIQQSAMDIKFGLTHEGKLLTFLEQLEKNSNGVFDLQKCLLKPAFAHGGIKPRSENVTAECRLNWYTLKENAPETDTETDTDIL